MGAQKPRDFMSSMNTNNNMNGYNAETNGMRPTATPPPMQQSPTYDPLPPPPPQQQQTFSSEPLNGNTNKVAPAMSYLEQLQRQQQMSPPPPTTMNVESPPPPPQQQQQQQPVVYNDFSEYERQLRKFTQGH